MANGFENKQVSITPSTPPAASQEDMQEVTEFIKWLADEQAQVSSKSQQAVLSYESGLLREKAHGEAEAVRDYLAAFNFDAEFREPMEALLALLERRKSFKNLGKVLEALVKGASSPEQSARAHVQRGQYLLQHQHDPAAARAAFEQAVEDWPDQIAGWLELEILAGKTDDRELRVKALEERSSRAAPGEWKALLAMDLAKLKVDQGDLDGATALLDDAAQMESSASFRVYRASEQVAHKAGQDDLVAQAIQAQARHILQAIEDPAAGDKLGVPLHVRSYDRVADHFLRASEALRRKGDVERAMAMLDQAIEKLPDDISLLYARLRGAEAAGDIEAAAAIATRLLDRGVSGKTAAPLWMRVFEAAAAAGDRDRALGALHQALTFDPGCIPARALQLDLLAEGDLAAYATSLEAMASEALSDEARGRAYLISALVRATQIKDVQGAKAALLQGEISGLSADLVSRIARSFAAVVVDDVWFEEATRRLIKTAVPDRERTSLWWELGRERLRHRDVNGAAEIFEALGSSQTGAWLGRVLATYALGLTSAGSETVSLTSRSPEQLERLAAVETDPVIARALSTVATVQKARAGDHAGALARARELHQADVADIMMATLLAELERASENIVGAAEPLAACAAATDDTDTAAAMHLEAAFLFWRGGERARAVQEISAADASHPEVAGRVLFWALAARGSDEIQVRRRLLELGETASGQDPVTAIERLAVESREGGDVDAVRGSLDALESGGLEELVVAGSLGRLVHVASGEDRDGRVHALEHLEKLGLRASAIVTAERYRTARAEDQDPQTARDQAMKWVGADGGLVPALELLASSRMADDVETEVLARRLLARTLPEGMRSAINAGAALLELISAPASEPPALLEGSGKAERLVNLELAPMGCDPRRRVAALAGASAVLGDSVAADAQLLRAWSLLVIGQAQQALALFHAVAENRPKDLAAWEGVRASAEALDDAAMQAEACEHLGGLCASAAKGAEFLEKAGLLWIERGGDPDRGERSLEASFQRDPRRDVAFDRLFRRVRDRNDTDRLLSLISRRLEVVDQYGEIAKLFWEQARALRQRGDFEGAMTSLETVTMLEPDHVGALALAGEVNIRQGEFSEAVEKLARLAALTDAPAQQRLVSGIAAVDLCENKLNDASKALDILLSLHRSGISTMQLRERLAKSAAQNEVWAEATAVLEILMTERSTPEGRIEAARLAMAIFRDKIKDPSAAEHAVMKLLDESHTDAEALDLLLSHDDIGTSASRGRVFERARRSLVGGISDQPVDVGKVDLLARTAKTLADLPLRHAALGAIVALGRGKDEIFKEIESLDARVARTPQVAIDDAAIEAIRDPKDGGPIPELLGLSSEVIAEALGPTLAGLGATKKDRVDERDGLPLRNEIAHWAGALGISEFELYLGGREPDSVFGVPGTPPIVVVGSNIGMPLTPAARQAIARELFALRRGISIVRTRDDATVASVVVALCNAVDVAIESPPYAMLAEVQRLISKTMSRKVKKSIPDICQRIGGSKLDPRAWVATALSSLDRMAVIAAGDVSVVLSDLLGKPREHLGDACRDNERARRLIAFVLSDRYLELRSQLGMGVQ